MDHPQLFPHRRRNALRSRISLPRRRTSLYWVCSRARRGPTSTALLARALERVPTPGAGWTVGSGVRVDGGCLGILIEVPGRGRLALNRAEDAFVEVWYDAFGDRDVGHLTTEVTSER